MAPCEQLHRALGVKARIEHARAAVCLDLTQRVPDFHLVNHQHRPRQCPNYRPQLYKYRHQQAREAVSGAELELLKAVAALNGMGIQLKGPLEGLIDFPSYREGELVELCWKLGEDRVEFWHRVGEGYAGRKKL